MTKKTDKISNRLILKRIEAERVMDKAQRLENLDWAVKQEVRMARALGYRSIKSALQGLSAYEREKRMDGKVRGLLQNGKTFSLLEVP